MSAADKPFKLFDDHGNAVAKSVPPAVAGGFNWRTRQALQAVLTCGPIVNRLCNSPDGHSNALKLKTEN